MLRFKTENGMKHLNPLLLIFLLLSISSCGFKAIYRSDDPIYKSLANIDISPESSSTEAADYYNHLKNILPYGKSAKYLLNTNFTFSKNFSVIQENSDILRETSTIIVTYKLTDKQSDKVITSNQFTRMSSFNSTFSPYSNAVKQQDVQKNLAIMAAEEVRNRIMLFIENDT